LTGRLTRALHFAQRNRHPNRAAASLFDVSYTRSVVLELRHRLQLVLGRVEDRVIRALGPIGAIGFANSGFVGRQRRYEYGATKL
jgi:hypothetical protein